MDVNPSKRPFERNRPISTHSLPFSKLAKIVDTISSGHHLGYSSRSSLRSPPEFPSVFKRKVVEASYQPGASVSMIVREHYVNANIVFRWRQQYQDGAFGPVGVSATFLSVEVIKAPIDLPSAAALPQKSHSGIVIEAGKATLRITGSPDPQTLQQLLR
ncbi:transposase [Pseudomonas orientalis]|uniref:transposase n=1 Tax=Pseudomonas orientalis TaxID=76758 RepID=UPI001FAEDDB4|nr:transposase [Pseudomonas orientalis]UOB23377.1 transposase [Pseudomonas orientalis]